MGYVVNAGGTPGQNPARTAGAVNEITGIVLTAGRCRPNRHIDGTLLLIDIEWEPGMRTACRFDLLVLLCLIFANGCVSHVASSQPPGPGQICYAKCLVYAEILNKHLPDPRENYSAIFLEGTAAEQQIFVREFNRKSFPVKNIELRVPAVYKSDADVTTGQRSLYFSAKVIEVSSRKVKFSVRGTGWSGTTTATVELINERWEVTKFETVANEWIS